MHGYDRCHFHQRSFSKGNSYHAANVSITIPYITMGQSSWLEIPTSQKLEIVVRRGGFHTQVSFAGSVGAIIEGSSLHSFLETMVEAVIHMFSGKAISPTLIGHFLVDVPLRHKLLGMILAERGCGMHGSFGEQQQEVHHTNIPVTNSDKLTEQF